MTGGMLGRPSFKRCMGFILVDNGYGLPVMVLYFIWLMGFSMPRFDISVLAHNSVCVTGTFTLVFNGEDMFEDGLFRLGIWSL